jgi:hypothetical protein
MKTGLCGTIRLPGSCGAARDFRKKYGETDADDIVVMNRLWTNTWRPEKIQTRSLNDMG